MKPIQDVPVALLSESQQFAFSEFFNKITEWRSFLEKLGFKLVAVDNYTSGNSPHEGYYYPSDTKGAIGGSITPQEAVEEGLIICGAGYVLPLQFSANTYWPEDLQDTPHYIEFGFGLNDKAFMAYEGNEGAPLFHVPKYFPFGDKGNRVEGTWVEIAEKLVAIARDMAQALSKLTPPLA